MYIDIRNSFGGKFKPMSGRDKQLTGNQDTSRVDFGNIVVDAAEKQGLVNDVFDQVADRYDLMNDVMSGGLHRIWKSILIDNLAPPKSGRSFHLLDVAGGTGDIANRFLDAGGAGCEVTLCDINPNMIAAGIAHSADKNRTEMMHFATGNAESLPFSDQTFDAYTIAFGIRNVTDIDKALGEAFRVLKPGGRFLCLEFSSIDVPGLDTIYDVYSNNAIPLMGKLITGNAEPYRYLVESIRKFPNQKLFCNMITAVGFERACHQNLTGGIVAIHSAWRL
jgi:demethylmenaquinone methyltransferase/2-methoxy-6-polyprenyl-1,4-benzoquinol methylase